MRRLITGNGAAAWGARLAGVDYIPAFPITPQTEIIETLSGWIESHDMPGRLVMLESEHSMVTAAGSAAVTGVRVFSATSSQGLLYATEMLYTVSGWRAPWVLVNVSRGISTPVTLEPDHNDIFAVRDCGFLQLHAADPQEVFDLILMAYRLGEDERVRLPVIVNMDGFYLSFTREPVKLPSAQKAAQFVGQYIPGNIKFRASTPLSHAAAVIQSSVYSYFRYEQHLALQAGIEVFAEIGEEFQEKFGRKYESVAEYHCEDAEYIFVMIGSFSIKALAAVEALRKAGEAVGLIRPRLIRPFPTEKLRQLLSGRRAVAIIDQNLAPGRGGVLHTEISSALYGSKSQPLLLSYIGGLGGRDFKPEEFLEIFRELKAATRSGETPPPRLLFSNSELKEMRKLQTVAGVERERVGGEDE